MSQGCPHSSTQMDPSSFVHAHGMEGGVKEGPVLTLPRS